MTLTKKLLTSGIVALGLVNTNARADIIANWHFDEGSGDYAYDSTGNGNTGTLDGATWTDDSINGNALHFNGSSDKVIVVKTPRVDLTTYVTLDAWIKRDVQQDGTILSRNGPFFIAVRDNKIYGGIHTDGGSEGWTYAQGTTDLQLNQWYRVGMSYDQSKVRVFVNETEEGNADKTGLMVKRSQAPFIGWGEPGQNQFFGGVIDEVKIFDVAIPESSALVALAAGAVGLSTARRRN